MSLGFRKSMFGFHRDDVVQYIETLQKNALAEKKDLEAQLDAFSQKIHSLELERDALLSVRDALQSEVEQYTAKYDEIQKLSEGVGRLYLVAQSNAQAVFKNVQESARISDAAVSENLGAIEQAQDTLSELKASLDSLSAQFMQNVDSLKEKLENAKTEITERRVDSEKTLDSFSQLVQKVAKE